MLDRRHLRLTIGLALISMAWLLAQSIAGLGEGLAMLTPAFMLLLALVVGWFPGEETIARWRDSRAVPRPRRARERRPRTHGDARVAPRGAALMASGMARRPPPAGIAAA